MITGNMFVMFIIGFIIFCFYLFGLLYAIYWGHNSQREDMENDPELRNYYNRHHNYDPIDYDGMGNQGRVGEVNVKDKTKKKNDKRRYRTKARQK
tara:strand:+ start:1747 stop:2031 length:285 start_codon:yes stop_codon:yes gene_type:complete